MKRSMIALSLVAVLAVSACSHGGSWTPMAEGRTAGKGTVENSKSGKAEKVFSNSLRK